MAAQHLAPQRHALWDQHSGRTRHSRATKLAIVLSIAAHAALGVYLYKTKFEPVYREIDSGPPTTVVLEKLRPKPPEPPPKQPEMKREPQPIQDPVIPRSTTQIAPDYVGPTVPLPPLEPVPHVESTLPEPALPPAAPTIVNPDWSSRPDAADMERYYPERAKRLDLNGRATIQCRVTAKGAVTDCSVIAEDPMGYAFGDAALKLSKLFKMKPKLQDGQAVEGATVKIPIAFQLR